MNKVAQSQLAAKAPATTAKLAFTLIEILVVVAVAGVLVALAIPALGRAMDRAGTAADLNNLRQIGHGISSFASENDGRIPNVTLPLVGNPASNFMESVDRSFEPDGKFNSLSQYNYLRRPIWFSKRFAKMPKGASFNPKTQYYWGLAYGMNVYLWYNASPLNGQNAFNGNLNRAPNLSKLVLVGEKNRNGGHEFDPRQSPSFADDVQTNYRISRDGKALYLFGDYHVELIEGDQSVAANPTFRTYSRDNRLYYAW